MKATFAPDTRKPFNVNCRKDKYFKNQFSAIVYDVEEDKMRECVIVRIYESDACAYSCVWVYDKDHYRHGTGRAGGGNYHRGSAAAGEAIYNAGIDLDEPINGRGDHAIEEAVEAIARELYKDKDVKIFVCEANP